jgi:putative FmdB family regulatory protein
MPIYEYRCTSCQDDFEVTQKISDAPLEECPKCQGRLEKMISQSSFVLKGTGWYMTDYGRKGSSGGGKDSGKEAKASEGSCSQAGSKSSCSGCPGSAGSGD